MFFKLIYPFLIFTKLRKQSDQDAEGDIALERVQRHKYSQLDTPSNILVPEAHSRASPLFSYKSSQLSDVKKPGDQHLKRSWWKKLSSWRYTVFGGLITTFFVLCCNVALLGWSYSKIDKTTGNALLYKGPCDQMKNIDTWSHFGINALSTLLLGVSNAAMQCIVAPSRADVDRAHAQNRLLDIGVNSLQNWRFMGHRRRMIWCLLLASTLPLHLV